MTILEILIKMSTFNLESYEKTLKGKFYCDDS